MKKRILIGYFIKDGTSPISSINQSIVSGLNDKYIFKRFYINPGNKNMPGTLSIINIFFTFITYIRWFFINITFRPSIAHYPITSYWSFEKSMLFLLTSKMFGAQVLGHLHGGAFRSFYSNLKGIRKKNGDKFIRYLDGIITLSESWNTYIQNTFPSTKNYCIPNPIDAEFENAFNNHQHNYSNNKLLFIGDLLKRKGIFDILDILKRNKNINISIAGSGDTNKLESKLFFNQVAAIKETERISLLGVIKNRQKVNIFRNSGILILPSYVENFPLVVIEAACVGLPIIASRIGALPDVFKHGDSILFNDPGDIDQLEHNITYLVNNKDERKRVGQGAKKVFHELLNRDEIINKYFNLYEYTLNNC